MKTLEMIFATSDGGTMRITVSNPKIPIDPAQVTAVMDLVVPKQLFATMSGRIIGKKSARVVDQTATPVSIA